MAWRCAIRPPGRRGRATRGLRTISTTARPLPAAPRARATTTVIRCHGAEASRRSARGGATNVVRAVVTGERARRTATGVTSPAYQPASRPGFGPSRSSRRVGLFHEAGLVGVRRRPRGVGVLQPCRVFLITLALVAEVGATDRVDIACVSAAAVSRRLLPAARCASPLWCCWAGTHLSRADLRSGRRYVGLLHVAKTGTRSRLVRLCVAVRIAHRARALWSASRNRGAVSTSSWPALFLPAARGRISAAAWHRSSWCPSCCRLRALV